MTVNCQDCTAKNINLGMNEVEAKNGAPSWNSLMLYYFHVRLAMESFCLLVLLLWV